jgi:phosphomannomutase
VLDIGLCGTEEVYFATAHTGAGGGLMVTASHNPIDWNGLKVVREGARPIAWETGLSEIHDLVVADTSARHRVAAPGPASTCGPPMPPMWRATSPPRVSARSAFS